MDTSGYMQNAGMGMAPPPMSVPYAQAQGIGVGGGPNPMSVPYAQAMGMGGGAQNFMPPSFNGMGGGTAPPGGMRYF